jgi:L-aspartate oxidase
MWNYVGIVRSEKRLLMVRKQLAPLIQDVHTFFHEYHLTPNLIELRNIALVAELIVRCALSRKESRGLHYMVDYPEQDDENWRKNTVL